MWNLGLAICSHVLIVAGTILLGTWALAAIEGDWVFYFVGAQPKDSFTAKVVALLGSCTLICVGWYLHLGLWQHAALSCLSGLIACVLISLCLNHSALESRNPAPGNLASCDGREQVKQA